MCIRSGIPSQATAPSLALHTSMLCCLHIFASTRNAIEIWVFRFHNPDRYGLLLTPCALYTQRVRSVRCERTSFTDRIHPPYIAYVERSLYSHRIAVTCQPKQAMRLYRYNCPTSPTDHSEFFGTPDCICYLAMAIPVARVYTFPANSGYYFRH